MAFGLEEVVEPVYEGEVRATRIDPAGPAVKRGRDWYVPVTYTLEDGRTVTTTKGRYSTKKAATEAATAREVSNVKAMFRDGDFWGVNSTFSIGLS